MDQDRRRVDHEWRESWEMRHLENLGRFSRIEERLKLMENELVSNLNEHSNLREALEQNTLITESIKRDTAVIVNLWKGATVFRKFLIWFLPLASSALTFYFSWVTFKK
jgi:hypothetical protein